MQSLLDTVRHHVNAWRRRADTRRERAFIEALLPAAELAPIVTQNRAIVRQIPRWIDDNVYDTSIFQYGIPPELRRFIDLEQGTEPTYADAMVYLSQRLTLPVNYLEIGVSVGKTFWQMANSLRQARVTGFDIEDFSPVIRKRLELASVEDWPTPVVSMRKRASSDHRFKLRDNDSAIRYLAADVFDPHAWQRLAGERFNLVFSDAFHSAAALHHEFRMIDDHELLDPDEFIVVWDDLHGEMRGAFEEIGAAIRRKFGLAPSAQFVIPLRGWVGVHESHHPVGFVVNLR